MKRPNRTATTLLWAVFCRGLGATNRAELRSSQLALTLRDGVVVELKNQLTQEAFAPVRLLAVVGFRDGPSAPRTRCEVLVNGASQFERVVESHDGWLPVEIDLTPWRGQPILLTCLTRSESYAYSSAVLWGEPRLASAAK